MAQRTRFVTGCGLANVFLEAPGAHYPPHFIKQMISRVMDCS